MNGNLKNGYDEKNLRKVFEEKNDEYNNLSFSVDSLKLKVADIKNKICDSKNSIRDSKKIDKMMYLLAGFIVGVSSIIGLLSSSRISSFIIYFGAISLSIPFSVLIQSATYRLHVKKELSDLNKQLSISENDLKENEKKLLDKKNEMTDKFYELVDCKAASKDEVMNLNTNKVLKKYEKPYIRIKKIKE